MHRTLGICLSWFYVGSSRCEGHAWVRREVPSPRGHCFGDVCRTRENLPPRQLAVG